MASAGRGSRVKGAVAERALVKRFLDAGIIAEKVSRSGYSTHDVEVILGGVKFRVESKNHSNGFARLYGWLGLLKRKKAVTTPADILVLKANHQPSLAVIPLDLLIKLLKQ